MPHDDNPTTKYQRLNLLLEIFCIPVFMKELQNICIFKSTARRLSDLCVSCFVHLTFSQTALAQTFVTETGSVGGTGVLRLNQVFCPPVLGPAEIQVSWGVFFVVVTMLALTRTTRTV